MTRFFIAIAAALFAVTSLFTPAAEACISCEYTPPVVNTPHPSAKRAYKKRSYQARKPSYSRKKNAGAKKRQKPTTHAKAKPTPAPSKAKADVAKADVKKDEDESVSKEVAKTEDTETGPRLTGSSALLQQSIPRREEKKPVETVEVGACKKFIPAVGATVSVACE